MVNRREFLGRGFVSLAAAAALPAIPSWANSAAIGANIGADNSRIIRIARRALAANVGVVRHRDVVGVTDFSAASRDPRFYLVDMMSGQVSRYLVAHGRGSDPSHTGWVQQFSNDPGSFASSPGAYLTGDYYTGKHGQSMRLMGLEHSNSNAEARAVVVHGAWYVSHEMARDKGKIGRSEGCFAFAEQDLPQVLNRLGPGRLLYATKL
jgi:hypothetical protein